MNMKALLLCASHNDIYLIKSLRKLGYSIVAIGNIPNLPGQKYVDKYIQLDYSDKEKVLEFARGEKINAIVQCCNDFGVYTASYVAERMGLPGYDSYDVTLTLHNKDRFKKFANDNGILSVKSYFFENIDEAKMWFQNAQFPLIVKPTDCSAGNGIHKITKIDDVDVALQDAFNKSRAGKIVIERFITGTQHGFCTFIKNRKVVAHCSNNEYSIMNPYRVEIDTWPADNEEKYASTLIQQIEKIADLLQLKDGIFHLQYIVQNGTPYIIEVMRRILGNMYGFPAGMVTGFDWDYWETRAKCGLSLSKLPFNTYQEGFFAYKTVLAEKNGIIESINVPPKYDRYIWNSFYLKQKGDLIKNYLSEPIGFLFMMFSSENEMRNVLIEQYENDFVKIL